MTIDVKNSLKLTTEQEMNITLRCVNLVDYLTDTANRIIHQFVQNIPCAEAKKTLLENPESLALRALEQAWKNIAKADNSGQAKH
ncbi:MAG: hypothetical protein K9L30_07920 [Desulfobacterales bacterium]|nr:hypothetical protein [Desulfobacterales bacterium]